MPLNRKYFAAVPLFLLLSCAEATRPGSSGEITGQILAGDQQSGTVGQTLPTPLRIQVTDPNGHPATGIPVVFTVTSGAGSLSTTEATTDVNGEAASAWTLGTSTGVSQQVSARLVRSSDDTVSIGTFVATPRPGPAQIAAVAGSGQMAAPSAPLADSLLARVADQYGNPVSNAHVTWTVTSGGGTLSHVVNTSNAAGYASARWTLGSSVGAQTVSAAIATLTPVVFTASSASSSDIVFTSVSPTDNALVGDTVAVVVTTSSTYQLSSVSADVGSRHVILTSTSSPTRWTGTLSLAGTPPGPVQLVISATDANHTTVLRSVPLVYAPRPLLTLTTPADDVVVGSSAHVQASCTQPHGSCSQVTVAVAGQVLASGATSIDATISLAAYIGQLVPLTFTATDANQQTTSTIRHVYVYADAHFSLVANVPGIVQDFDGSRVLYVDSAHVLKIRTLGGADISVYSPTPGGMPARGALTPGGAVFEVWNSILMAADNNLYEYADGTVNVIGDIRSHPWVVNGSYFAWVNSSNTLTLRDFTNGTNTPIATNINGFFGVDVSPNGDVAYGMPQPGLVKIKFVPKGGSEISVTNTVWSELPRTDGTTIVYTQVVGGGGRQFASWSAADGETLLGVPIQNAHFGSDAYPVNNGWFLYATDGPPRNDFQVWSVSPAKVARQVSKFTIASFAKGLGANGEVIFVSGSYAYLALPPYSSEALIGPAVDLAKVVWQNGHLYALVGASVVLVQ